jgi:hypothetical protein
MDGLLLVFLDLLQLELHSFLLSDHQSLGCCGRLHNLLLEITPKEQVEEKLEN